MENDANPQQRALNCRRHRKRRLSVAPIYCCLIIVLAILSQKNCALMTVKFFYPLTRIQPMGQNVIQNVKLGYSKLLLTNILNDPVHNENLEKAQTNVNLKDVFSLANCWAYMSTLLINKSWKNLLPNFIDSEVEEIQLASLINQLQNKNPMSNTKAFQWAAEVDDSLVRNEIFTDDEIITKVTAEDDNNDDVTPVNRQNFSF
ncbi:hypothetical protein AVEN_97973-1 [Araneus ventricosus]|uniref:DDE-1 domain-containing protein n=1 Tax=Araneus ventricosus TaxID=182803 RepID=A0A4Y2PZ88_ARAVE|nr:hypothetical protein AVEN_97973-1 [Araneus ventricosus]